MPSFSTVESENASFKPTYERPVAIFVGGTSGIGAAMAAAFAKHTKGNADIVIVGRNRSAAESLLNSMPVITGEPKPQREFLSCDATLMREVERVTTDIRTRYPKINFLVLSPGIFIIKGRDETDEGIDKKLALHYYARWRFIHDLVSQLQAAHDAGEDAKVMSVLAAGKGSAVDVNDLGLRKGFSTAAAAAATPTYTDCMIESFATRYPKLSFIHAYPGFVNTPLISGLSGTGSFIITPLLSLAVRVVGIPPSKCAEYMWHTIYNAGPGASRTGTQGEPVTGRLFTSGIVDQVWEHSVKETRIRDS